MSNFLALATVTATLSQVIQTAIDIDVSGARVTTVRPDIAGNGPTEAKVNVFLYQVTSNAAFRNVDLPTRRSDSSLMQKPKVALDLHYLLTFYGDEVQLIPQQLLGSVVRTLHSQPMLTRDQINNTISGGTFSFLANSDLADDVELVKFTPIPLSIEEISKLWSMLLQTPYALSIVYIGTVVLIEGDEVPRQALPVKTPLVYVRPFETPVIDELYPASAENLLPQVRAKQPIRLSDTLVVKGKHLRGNNTLSTNVKISGQLAAATPTNGDPNKLSVTLPNTLRAGIQGLQVIQSLLLGDPDHPDNPDPKIAKPHDSFESNVLPFVLHPTITKIAPVNPANVTTDANGNISTTITITVAPKISPRQRVSLLLNEALGGAGNAYSFVAAARTGDVDTISFSISGVKKAKYTLRVQVDGADSLIGQGNDQIDLSKGGQP